ncbi:hypothetical protein ACWDKQ_09315 [Saccharopolyspora sp. NPDC000995]
MLLRNGGLLLGRGLMRLRNGILLRCDLLLVRELLWRLHLRLHHAAQIRQSLADDMQLTCDQLQCFAGL